MNSIRAASSIKAIDAPRLFAHRPESEDRQFRIERADVSAQAFSQRRRTGVATSVDEHHRLVVLVERQIEIRPRRLRKRGIFDVAHHADDGVDADRNPVADRIGRRRPEGRAIVSLIITACGADSSSARRKSRPASNGIFNVWK
jgi:hypothetical protein